MKCTQYYPVLQTTEVTGLAAFYVENFGFRAMFESDWYQHLQSTEDAGVNLAILQADHPTIPEGYRGETRHVILNFEVEDVDALHDRARAMGWKIIKPLCDEDFGQRHFVTCDPQGNLIDIITPIEPSAEFLSQFAPEAVGV